MVFGSDAAIYPHGDNGKQFSRMVTYGMTGKADIYAREIVMEGLISTFESP